MASNSNNDDKFDQLIIGLKASFDDYLRKRSDINNCKRAFNELQVHVSANNKDGKLKNKECAPILRMIFFPFAVKLIKGNNSAASFLMISIVTWWLEKRNEDKVPSINLLNLILEQKVYPSAKINITNSKNEKLGFPASESHPKSLKILIKLFEIKDSSSTDCDNLVCLIDAILKSVLKDEKKDGLKYIFDDCDFRHLWKLYFDPLLISQALTANLKKELGQYVGKETFIPTDANWTQVRWTDERSDKHIKESTRKRVDFIIHIYLENFDWIDRQKIIESINWDDIKFRSENIEFLCKKFLELISYYFKKFDEKRELTIAVNLNTFLDSLASCGNMLFQNVNFFKGFVSKILEDPHRKLIENSDIFIQHFVKTLTEKSETELGRKNKSDFEKYLENYLMKMQVSPSAQFIFI